MRKSRFIQIRPWGGSGGELCTHLKESLNQTWSGFAAVCAGQGLVATDDCEECLAVSTASVARTVRFQIISDQPIL